MLTAEGRTSPRRILPSRPGAIVLLKPLRLVRTDPEKVAATRVCDDECSKWELCRRPRARAHAHTHLPASASAASVPPSPANDCFDARPLCVPRGRLPLARCLLARGEGEAKGLHCRSWRQHAGNRLPPVSRALEKCQEGRGMDSTSG